MFGFVIFTIQREDEARKIFVVWVTSTGISKKFIIKHIPYVSYRTNMGPVTGQLCLKF